VGGSFTLADRRDFHGQRDGIRGSGRVHGPVFDRSRSIGEWSGGGGRSRCAVSSSGGGADGPIDLNRLRNGARRRGGRSRRFVASSLEGEAALIIGVSSHGSIGRSVDGAGNGGGEEGPPMDRSVGRSMERGTEAGRRVLPWIGRSVGRWSGERRRGGGCLRRRSSRAGRCPLIVVVVVVVVARTSSSNRAHSPRSHHLSSWLLN